LALKFLINFVDSLFHAAVPLQQGMHLPFHFLLPAHTHKQPDYVTAYYGNGKHEYQTNINGLSPKDIHRYMLKVLHGKQNHNSG
jgi:hypothetical protein